MSPVISKRTLKNLIAYAERPSENTYALVNALPELRAAIKPKRSVKLAKATKRKKDRAHAVETSDIRAAVMKRAGYECEYCGTPETPGNPLTLEHMFGRVKTPQSVANCWALCLSCHRQKTAGIPSAFHWFQMFAVQCGNRGDLETKAAALKDGEWRQAKKDADANRRASALSRGVGP